MAPYQDLSVDQKAILWSAIVTLLLVVPVFALGATLTIFSLMLGLAPHNLLARIFGDSVREMLPLVFLLSYSMGLGLVLGAYWVLTRGIKILFGRSLGIALLPQKFERIKIACAVAVNVLFFLFLYVLFPAGPGSYP